MPMLEERKPADICICTLLDKPERREVEVDVKYMALTFLMNLLSVMDLIMTRAIETFLL